MSQKMNPSAKVSKTQLMYILDVSYKTATKEYQTLLDCLQLKRNFLTIQDLIDLKILP
jgi:hypothetical protein